MFQIDEDKVFHSYTLIFFISGAQNFIMLNIAYLWLKEIISKMQGKISNLTRGKIFVFLEHS